MADGGALTRPLLDVVQQPSDRPAAGWRAGMPLEDVIFMSPWRKWRVHRHPPLKLVLHVLLIVVATPTIMVAEWQKVSFLHDLRVELVKLYFPIRCSPQCLQGGGTGLRYCQLPPHCAFSLVDEVTTFVEGVVDSYNTCKARLVPRVDYIRPHGHGSEPEPVHLRVQYLDASDAPAMLTGVQRYELRQGGPLERLGPLGGVPSRNISQREVFDRLDSLHLSLHFLSTEYDELYLSGKYRSLNVLYPPGPIAWSYGLSLVPSAGRQLLELRSELRVEVRADPTVGWRQIAFHVAFQAWALIALLAVATLALALRSIALALIRVRMLDRAAEDAHRMHETGTSLGEAEGETEHWALPGSIIVDGADGARPEGAATGGDGGDAAAADAFAERAPRRVSADDRRRSHTPSPPAASRFTHVAPGSIAAAGGSSSSSGAGGAVAVVVGARWYDAADAEAALAVLPKVACSPLHRMSSRPGMLGTPPLAAAAPPRAGAGTGDRSPPRDMRRSTGVDGAGAQVGATRDAPRANDTPPASAPPREPAAVTAVAGGAPRQALRVPVPARAGESDLRPTGARGEPVEPAATSRGAHGSAVTDARAAATWVRRGRAKRIFSLLSNHTLLLAVGSACLLGASLVRLRGLVRSVESLDLVDRGAQSGTVALGIASLWVSLTRYFEWVPALYTFTHTIRCGAKNTLTLMTAVLPIFFAYALAGTVLFSDATGNFSGFSTSCVTLWAMAAGDEVNESFRQVYAARPVVGRLYVLSFTTVFYFICANLIIQIIEAAHYAALRDIFDASGSRAIQRLLDRSDADGGAGATPTAPHAELVRHALAAHEPRACESTRLPAAEGEGGEPAPGAALSAHAMTLAIARLELAMRQQQRALDELLHAQRLAVQRAST